MSTTFSSSSGGGSQRPANPSPPTLVDSRPKLAALIEAAQDEPMIGVDTESNSLFAYFHQVCLVQISLPGHDYVIDPLAVDITPLSELFASQSCQKIFHAAENDILGLKRDYSFHFANIFDTMLAARILGWSQAGLAAILADKFGAQLNKSLQRADWGRRPLDQTLLAYAQLDTHYLLALRSQQEAVPPGSEIEPRECGAPELAGLQFCGCERGVGPCGISFSPLHRQNLRVQRGQALLRGGLGRAFGARLKQGQGCQNGIVLHDPLAQQAVHDAGVGLEPVPQLKPFDAREHGATGQG